MMQVATILMVTLFSLPLSGGSGHRFSQAAGEVGATQQRLASIREQVAGLGKASPLQSFDDAFAAIEAVSFNSVPRLPPESDSAKSVTRIWVEYLAKLDGALGEANKDHKRPVTVVSPGRDSDGVVYLPGVSPDTIKDPAVRKRYLEDIAENEERRKKAFLIHDLTNLNLKAWAYFETWLFGNYTHNVQEARELSVLARQQPFSATSLEKFDQMLKKISQP